MEIAANELYPQTTEHVNTTLPVELTFEFKINLRNADIGH